MQFIDNISWPILLVICIFLGFAPFVPEPHIVEKLRMLFQGNLKKPIDIFDLVYHAAPFVLLGIKLFRMTKGSSG